MPFAIALSFSADGRLFIIGVSEKAGGKKAADWIKEMCEQLQAYRKIGGPCPLFGDTGLIDCDPISCVRREEAKVRFM